MELVPFEQDAEPIKIGSCVKKVTLGRAEITKSLQTKEKIRVSKDQIRLEIDYDKKIIQIETLGINPSSFGKFGYPPTPLRKNNKATVVAEDIIGFGRTQYFYQVKFGDESLPKSLKKEIDKSKVEIDSPIRSEPSEPSSDENHDEKPESEEEKPTCSGPGLIPKRKPCEYGANCYRKNPAHKNEMSHPGDLDYWDPVSTSIDPVLDTRPECSYGILCYQRSDSHRRKFAHNTVGKKRKRRAAMKADLKDFSESSGDELENSSLSENSDWSDDDNASAVPVSAKIIKLTEEQKEKLKETQNLLRKNVF